MTTYIELGVSLLSVRHLAERSTFDGVTTWELVPI